MLQKLIDGKVDIKQSRSGQKQLIDKLYYKLIVDSDYKFNWLLSDIEKDEKEHRKFASSPLIRYDLSILYTAKFFSIQYILIGLQNPDITFDARDIVSLRQTYLTGVSLGSLWAETITKNFPMTNENKLYVELFEQLDYIDFIKEVGE
tara:strand:+ start:1736 stop:2179 length:444 start_codon:yes stop_codon:yes gene_type:complete